MIQMNLLKIKIPAIKLSFIISLILVETAKFSFLKNKAISTLRLEITFNNLMNLDDLCVKSKMNKHRKKYV